MRNGTAGRLRPQPGLDATAEEPTGKEVAVFVRVAWGRLAEGAWEEYEQLYREHVAGRAVEGLRGRILLRGLDDRDEGVSVSLWRSMTDMDRYQTAAIYDDAPALQQVLRGDWLVREFSVRLDVAHTNR